MNIRTLISFAAIAALMVSFDASAAAKRTLTVTPTYTVQIKEDESGSGPSTQWFECTESRDPINTFKNVEENKPKSAPKYFALKLAKNPFKDGNITRTEEMTKYMKRCSDKVAEAVKEYGKPEYKERDGNYFTLNANLKKNDKVVRIVNGSGKVFVVDIDSGKLVEDKKPQSKGDNAVANTKRGKAKPVIEVCLQDTDSKKVFTPKMSALIRENWSKRFVGDMPTEIGAEKFYYITGQEEGPFARGEDICNEAGKKVETVEEMERVWPSMAGIMTLDGAVPRGDSPVGAACEGFERDNLRGKIVAYGVPKADYADKPKEKTYDEDAKEPLTRGYFCKYKYKSCGIKTKVVSCTGPAIEE
ncbi:MAG: hypothetical protein EB060_06855 [Proteobacteria bacterium]|nr:hypothetical protein [Pseudomonadota bacterium]